MAVALRVRYRATVGIIDHDTWLIDPGPGDLYEIVPGDGHYRAAGIRGIHEQLRWTSTRNATACARDVSKQRRVFDMRISLFTLALLAKFDSTAAWIFESAQRGEVLAIHIYFGDFVVSYRDQESAS